MSDNMIVALVAFIGSLLVIITPVIRLNGHITELTVLFRELKELVKEKTDSLDKRVTEHGKEIDEIRLKQTEHDAQIKQLEKSIYK